MLSNDSKKQILVWVQELIKNVSDKAYQNRVWIRGEGPECDDFDETCCNFFGAVDPLLKDYKDYWLTDNQYQILKNFRDEFEKFSDVNDLPQLFIDTPEWTRITLMAKEVLKTSN